jgi:hypothetical protein
VESCCEFGIDTSGSMKCWETIERPTSGLSSMLSSIELVSMVIRHRTSLMRRCNTSRKVAGSNPDEVVGFT